MMQKTTNSPQKDPGATSLMNHTSTPEPRSSLIAGAKRRRLLIGTGLAFLVIGSVMLLEAEHRFKLLGLWPILFFVPIPLLTWINHRREEARRSSRARGGLTKPEKVVASPTSNNVAQI